jgi:hypothetical protein
VFGIFVVSKYISYADVIGKLCLKRKNATVIAEKALVQKNPPLSKGEDGVLQVRSALRCPPFCKGGGGGIYAAGTALVSFQGVNL